MLIYLAVNKVNHKAYVGQTANRFHVRISNHINVAQMNRDETAFHRALRKYGKESFDFAVLEQCANRQLLDEREQYWIAHLGCRTPIGYNRTDGGQGATGAEYTPERREKLRQSQLGERNRMKNPETVRKHALAISGPRHIYWGKFGPEHPRFGKHHKLSEETKAKQRAYWNTPEVREKRRQLMLARQVELNTPEMKAKRAEGRRRYFANRRIEETMNQFKLWENI